MERLTLHAGGYSGTYKLVGGRLALDFVNTVSWPNDERRHDWLASSENVTTWLAAVGLPPVATTEAQRRRVVRIRATLDAVIRPIAHGMSPSPGAVNDLSQLARGSLMRRHIDPATLRWGPDPAASISQPLDPVVLDATELVIGSPDDRLRYCPSCDWLFEDHSRNGQRRWCDMADCGSRHKARVYYHRSKSEGAPPTVISPR